jgi:alanine dehydrogenase
VHVRGMRAFKVISSELLKEVSQWKKKIIMDVSIDQGGNFPEAHSTTYENPLYLDSFGNLCFSVANIPSFAGGAASDALAEAAYPYSLALAVDPSAAFKNYPELLHAINIEKGSIKLDVVKEAHLNRAA